MVALSQVRVVFDTNVLISALRSASGASAQILLGLGTGKFRPVISNTVFKEYQDVFRRPHLLPQYSVQEINDLLDYFFSECLKCQIYFRWRPFLPDRKDEAFFELALASEAPYIVTHNVRDFRGVESMGVEAVTPSEFLRILKNL
jgi:putative PIN family toxin of toxin-antitoxin system